MEDLRATMGLSLLNLIVGLYLMLGAALGLIVMWLFLAAPTP